MPPLLLIWTLFLAFLVAHLEVNIEGRHGWAKKLPTWRMKNRFTSVFFTSKPLTGYHFWFFAIFFSLFHAPIFFGIAWTPVLEVQMVTMFFIFLVAEDFLWFVVNPAFGLRRFQKKYVTWHHHWFLGLPTGYYKAFIIIFSLYYLSTLLMHY